MSLALPYRYYQKAAIEAIMAYIYASPAGSHGLVCMPTGTGKSVVQDGFVYEFMQLYPQLRFLCVTHSKQLIKQNEETMRRLWEYAPTGIYSAGLKRRDTAMPIIFGGIQSMIKHVEEFGWRDFVFIDEAHLVSPDEETQYAEFIRRILAINPNCRFIGLTATAWRTKEGDLEGNGGLFTDIIYDVTTMEWFNRFIAEGYLAPLITRPTATEFDVSQLGTVNGDYSIKQAEEQFDNDELTRKILTEACHYGQDRRSWLTFASGVNHAEHINDMLNEWGIPSVVVHSKVKKQYEERLEAYQKGWVRSIVNFGVLTTGFDDPKTDLILMMRATKAPGLWVQMLGRGTRPSPLTGKTNCLCLDFGGNARRLGPINDVIRPKNKKKGNSGGGAAPIKICRNCGNWCHASVRFCEWCNNEFLQNVSLYEEAGTDEVMTTGVPQIETFQVRAIFLNKGGKAGKRPYLKVTYYLQDSVIEYSEYVLLEHDGLPRHRAHEWWKKRHVTNPPETVDEALRYLGELRSPREIRVWVNKLPYPEVVGHEF